MTTGLRLTEVPPNTPTEKELFLTMKLHTSRINLDYFLSGDHDINKDFNVKYLVGGTVRQNRYEDVAVGGNNLVVPYLYNVAVRSGDANVPTFNGNVYPSGTVPNTNYASNNYDITSRLLSAYGTIGFTYKGWANVEITGRNDWDSRLLKENRSFFYPAANVSLVLSDAISALQNSNTISYLKVRGAISKSGNVNLNPYSSRLLIHSLRDFHMAIPLDLVQTKLYLLQT